MNPFRLKFNAMSQKMKYPNFVLTVFAWVQVLCFLMAVPAMAAETVIQVGGTGSATPLIEALGKAYKRKALDVQIRVMHPPMGSSAALRAVMAGAIDLAFSGKPLGAAEREKGGQDWELGSTPFLLVTREPGRLGNVDLARLAEIYAGRVATWTDGAPIRLVLRAPQESDTLLLRNLSESMDKAVELAMTRTGLPVAANDLENVALLEKTPGALGTSNLALLIGLESSLHPVSLNGVAPTLANLEKGLYPHAKPIYAIRGPAISSSASRFLEFMLSAEGRKVIAKQGYLPAKSGR